MLRRITALLAVALLVACVSAKEYKGSITKIDTDKKTVTIKVDDKDKTFSYTDKTEFVGGKGPISQENFAKFAGKVAGRNATIETDEKDGKEVTDKDGNAVLKSMKVGKKDKSN
jgi:hypothetical protein